MLSLWSWQLLQFLFAFLDCFVVSGCVLIYYCTYKVCVKPELDFFSRRNIGGGIVGELLEKKDETGMKAKISSDLGLNQILERNLEDLSYGEFQRFYIGLIAVQKAEVYIFDKPSEYLDVKQRLKAAQVIRSLRRPDRSFYLSCHFDVNCMCLAMRFTSKYALNLFQSIRSRRSIFGKTTWISMERMTKHLYCF